MEFQNLIQGSTPWKIWRSQGLGSTAAAVIMGESEWQTPIELWEQLLGLRPETVATAPMIHGSNTEPTARAQYEIDHDAEMPPALVEHKEYPFLRASLDGLNRELKTILEIKCPYGPKTHEIAKSGEIPRRYIWQLVHQLMVADMDVVHYYSFFKGDGILLKFERDLKLEKELLAKEIPFWEENILKKVPPELTDRDFTILKSKDAKFLFNTFKEKKIEVDEATKDLELIKEQIIKISNGQRVLCEGVQVMPITRKGNVDYAKIPALKGLDLEQFRKAASSYTDVRIKK